MQNHIIATAKRIADTYGEWIGKGYNDRKERLDRLLSKVTPNKTREKARSLIEFRYSE